MDLGLLIGVIAFGIVVGALGRLVIPGPDPMSLLETTAVGLAAGAISGLINAAFSGPGYLPFPLTVIIAGGIVWYVRRRRAEPATPPPG